MVSIFENKGNFPKKVRTLEIGIGVSTEYSVTKVVDLFVCLLFVGSNLPKLMETYFRKTNLLRPTYKNVFLEIKRFYKKIC